MRFALGFFIERRIWDDKKYNRIRDLIWEETAKETEVTEGMTFTAKLKLNAVQADGGHAYESGTAGVTANPRP